MDTQHQRAKTDHAESETERLHLAGCGNCVYFDKAPKGFVHTCRRHPPTRAGLLGKAAFPTVSMMDWCGSFTWKRDREESH